MKPTGKSETITLNYHTYPLVVGNSNKYTFDEWERMGSTVQLTAVVTDSVYSQEDILWQSKDDCIAVVEDGMVRARTTGFTKVFAVIPSGKKAVCHIAVIDNITRSTVMSLSLNAEKLCLEKGKSVKLIPIIYPEDILGNGAMNRGVKWESSDSDIAFVAENGKVTALSPGTAIIKVSSNDIGRSAECRVTVTETGLEESAICRLIPISGENRSGTIWDEAEGVPYSIIAGESLLLQAEFSKFTEDIQWKSNNSYIADVETSGKVTAYSSGQVDILATTVQGGACCRFSLRVKPASIKTQAVYINRKKSNMVKGTCGKLYALTAPAPLTNPHFTWQSSDNNIVKILSCSKNVYGAEEIIIQAIHTGTAVITASKDGYSASCQITVSEMERKVSCIQIEKTKNISVDQVYSMEAVINKDATEPKLLWLSGNRRIVTVNQAGILRGNQSGTTNIYVLAWDSLTREQQRAVEKLNKIRSLEEKEDYQDELKQIRKTAVYGVCLFTVKEENACLRNLHISSETVTASSVNLLWNRASLLDTGDFDRYLVYCNETYIDTTRKLGYTVKNLKSDTVYDFKVAAVSKEGNPMASQKVSVRTKRPSLIIDVIQAPYNAVGNGKVVDTLGIQAAIDSCPEGGTVLLPEGHVFYSGALFLKSNITFQVDGILIGSIDPKNHPKVVTRWEGWRKLEQSSEQWDNTSEEVPINHCAHASLLNAGIYDEGEIGQMGPYNIENLVICGKGMINGNGFKLGYNEGPNPFTEHGGRPVPESTKTDPTLRGRTLTIHNGHNIYIRDVLIAYSPSWTIHTIYCDQITFDHVTIISKGTGKTGAADDVCILNGDGIDPESCTNMNIFDCFFFVGDDAVALKSGRNKEGNELNKPNAYIRITDCISEGSKGGFCIGSEQASGAHDILWQNLNVKNVDLFGLWIKSCRARGGLIEDILWRDCLLIETQGGIFLEDAYRTAMFNPADMPPDIGYVTFENIRSVDHKDFGMRIVGLPDACIHDVTLRGVSFQRIRNEEGESFEIKCGNNIVLKDVVLPEEYQWAVDAVSSVVYDCSL